MGSHVFTYGSLMFPQVWKSVVRGNYRSAPATVNGHARFAVAGQTYPGMIACPGAAVRGVVYFDVDAADLAALDAFEGPAYRREQVAAALDDGTTLTAGAYIHIDKSGLSDAQWNPERFRIESFMDRFCGTARPSNK
jgi:gamma-glutamylcyclotransferase (GGCT)/AIG2-like uncharacterized protein YtfP